MHEFASFYAGRENKIFSSEQPGSPPRVVMLCGCYCSADDKTGKNLKEAGYECC
jgi:hypothetical protein